MEDFPAMFDDMANIYSTWCVTLYLEKQGKWLVNRPRVALAERLANAAGEKAAGIRPREPGVHPSTVLLEGHEDQPSSTIIIYIYICDMYINI